MKINNSISGRIGCVVFAFGIALLQLYLYPILGAKLAFEKEAITTKAIVKEKKENEINFIFSNNKGTIVTVKRKISNYNPFVSTMQGDSVELRYLPNNMNVFLVKGFDKKTPLIILFFSYVMPVLSQIVFLLVAFNFMDEKRINFKKQ